MIDHFIISLIFIDIIKHLCVRARAHACYIRHTDTAAAAVILVVLVYAIETFSREDYERRSFFKLITDSARRWRITRHFALKHRYEAGCELAQSSRYTILAQTARANARSSSG